MSWEKVTRLMFYMCELNKAVFLNNWFLSTNLWPDVRSIRSALVGVVWCGWQEIMNRSFVIRSEAPMCSESYCAQ
jgi:hypothetical protein